jgi:4-aminobutyrate aminotransferase-like enzyme
MMGKKLVARLISFQEQYSVIGDMDGLGLMVATEFTTPSGEPDKKIAEAVRNKCLDDGLILLTCGSYGNVIRWIPPLIIDDTHLEEALNIFQQALEGT